MLMSFEKLWQWAGLPKALIAMGDRTGDGVISLAEFRQLAAVLGANAALRQSMGM